MKLLIVFLHWIAIFLFCIYFSLFFYDVNIETPSRLFLVLGTILGCGLLAVNNTIQISLNKSSLILGLFFMYFLLKMLIDLDEINLVLEYAIGQTGGIFISLSSGILISSILHVKNNNIKNKLEKNLDFILFQLFLIFSILIFFLSINKNIIDVQQLIFLVEDNNGIYQRMGNYITLYFITTSIVMTSHCLIHTIKGFNRLCTYLLYIATTVLAMFYSQLIGSNSAFLCVIIVFIVTISFINMQYKNKYFVASLNKLSYPISFHSWGFSIKLLISTIPMMLLLSGLFLIYLYINDIDLLKLRIFNFGLTDTLLSHSFESRFDLLASDYIQQITYAPIIGDMSVDRITTGAGTYAHSLPLSLASHTGLVGLTLFTIYTTLAFREIKNLFNLHKNLIFLFQKFLFICILVISSLTTFFIWIPLWFALGICFHPYIKINNFQNSAFRK